MLLLQVYSHIFINIFIWNSHAYHNHITLLLWYSQENPRNGYASQNQYWLAVLTSNLLLLSVIFFRFKALPIKKTPLNFLVSIVCQLELLTRRLGFGCWCLRICRSYKCSTVIYIYMSDLGILSIFIYRICYINIKSTLQSVIFFRFKALPPKKLL